MPGINSLSISQTVNMFQFNESRDMHMCLSSHTHAHRADMPVVLTHSMQSECIRTHFTHTHPDNNSSTRCPKSSHAHAHRLRARPSQRGPRKKKRHALCESPLLLMHSLSACTKHTQKRIHTPQVLTRASLYLAAPKHSHTVTINNRTVQNIFPALLESVTCQVTRLAHVSDQKVPKITCSVCGHEETRPVEVESNLGMTVGIAELCVSDNKLVVK